MLAFLEDLAHLPKLRNFNTNDFPEKSSHTICRAVPKPTHARKNGVLDPPTPENLICRPY